MHSNTLGRLFTALVGFLLAFPATALACPVCGFVGTGDNIGAYRSTTVLLSAVPLVMIAGIATWLVRRTRQDS